MGIIVKYKITKKWVLDEGCYVFAVIDERGTPFFTLKQEGNLALMSDDMMVELVSNMADQYFKKREVVGDVRFESPNPDYILKFKDEE